MKKDELETLLEELDEALVTTFPGPEPIRALVVGGACLLFADVTTRQTKDVDVIIFDLMGAGEASLVYNLTPTTAKIRKMIGAIGKRHGLRGNDRMSSMMIAPWSISSFVIHLTRSCMTFREHSR